MTDVMPGYSQCEKKKQAKLVILTLSCFFPQFKGTIDRNQKQHQLMCMLYINTKMHECTQREPNTLLQHFFQKLKRSFHKLCLALTSLLDLGIKIWKTAIIFYIYIVCVCRCVCVVGVGVCRCVCV